MKNIRKKIPVVLISIGILFTATSVILYLSTKSFIEDSEKTTGEVIAIIDVPADLEGSGGVMYAPVIRFTTDRGNTITFQSAHATNPASYREGDKVQVLYDPDDPGTARMHDFMSLWIAPIVSLFLGICLLAAAGWRSRTLPLIMVAILLVSCGSTEPAQPAGSDAPSRTLIWCHSDMQPENEHELEYYRTAVDDMVRSYPRVDIGLVPGDIVYAKKNAAFYYNAYHETRKKLKTSCWLEIAGNHEARHLEAFVKNIGKPLHYASRYGNILFILMSDEKRTPMQEISDEAFRWWKDLVIRNQDKIIITVTHACLKQSGLLSSAFPTMRIAKSDRFAEVLKDYHVDIWISGHSHLPTYFQGKVNRPFRYRDTLFLEVAAIRKDIISGIESWIILLEDGSRNIRVTARNHGRAKELWNMTFTHELRISYTKDTQARDNCTVIPFTGALQP